MKDICELQTCCGSFCGSCPNFLGEREPRCTGCSMNQGHPFWGACQVYSCAGSRGVEHCGHCIEFPCESFIDHYDPSNPEGQRNAVVRAGLLAYRARHGDGKALNLLRKLEKKQQP